MTFRTSPTIGLRRNGGRLRFDGRYSPVILGYLNDSREESLFNTLSASASYEAVESRVFLDSRAAISQSFLSPFGSQPAEFSTASVNRTEVRTLGLSPYIRGRFGDGGRYLLRSDNSNTTLSTNAALSLTTTGVSAEASGSQSSFVSLGVNGSHTTSSYGSGASIVNQTASVRATLNADPEFVPYLTGGYEYNEFFRSTFQGPRYGGGFRWQPSPLTSIDVGIEKRYFGTSLNVDATYRTRLSLWSLRAYRTDRITPFGGGFGLTPISTRDFLSNQLRGRFTDEAERQIEVERLMATGALPTTLTAQAALASPRVLLVEGVEPSVAITGVRNSFLGTLFWRRSTPLSGNGGVNFTDVFNAVNGFEQVGGAVTWTHRFDEQLSANIGADRTHTTSIRANAVRPASLETVQTVFRFFLDRTIGPQTSVSAGLRLTRLSTATVSGLPIESRERALQFGVVHSFY